jgi:hypothetical protein
MYNKLTNAQEQELLSKPETGMGYQIIEANDALTYAQRKMIVLNAQIAVDRGMNEAADIKTVINKGIFFAKASAELIVLKNIRVLNESEFRGTVNEPKGEKEKGAIDNPKEKANGYEVFVRLSAFDDDTRVDKVNKRLLPGSFSTTEEDYKECKAKNDEPIERYALPGNDKIEWAFYIVPTRMDTLQRGTVQPANGRKGGGKEIYFENGTSIGTFVKQTHY